MTPSAPPAPAAMPPLQARVDPPAHVQEAIAAAVRACQEWTPTAFPLTPGGPAPKVPTATIEAQVCDLIGDPVATIQMFGVLGIGAGIGALLAVVVGLYLTLRLVGFAVRLSRRWRDRLALRRAGQAVS